MYPGFVLLKEKNLFNGLRVLEICGQPYTALADDHFIDEAIELAGYWEPYQVTYARVVHLAYWIRENEKHGAPFKGLIGMLECKAFVDRIIEAEFPDLGGRYQANFLKSMRENERIFFEEDFINTA